MLVIENSVDILPKNRCRGLGSSCRSDFIEVYSQMSNPGSVEDIRVEICASY